MSESEQRDRVLWLALRRALLLVVGAIDARYEPQRPPQKTQEHAGGRV